MFLKNLQNSQKNTVLKKKLWHKCFLVNFAELLRIPFFIEHPRWLVQSPNVLKSARKKPQLFTLRNLFNKSCIQNHPFSCLEYFNYLKNLMSMSQSSRGWTWWCHWLYKSKMYLLLILFYMLFFSSEKVFLCMDSLFLQQYIVLYYNNVIIFNPSYNAGSSTLQFESLIIEQVRVWKLNTYQRKKEVSKIVVKSLILLQIYFHYHTITGPYKMKKNSWGGGEELPIMKYCRPPWLADEKKFPFQIVYNG